MTGKELFPSHRERRRDSEQLSDDTWMIIISLAMSRSAKIISHWLMSPMTQSIASHGLSGQKREISSAVLGSHRLNFSWSIVSDSETGSPLVLCETASEYSSFFPLVWRALKSAWKKKDVLSSMIQSGICVWRFSIELSQFLAIGKRTAPNVNQTFQLDRAHSSTLFFSKKKKKTRAPMK